MDNSLNGTRRNYVADAIETLGGPTRTGNLLEISTTSVHYLRKVGRVTNAELALKLEYFTALAGKPVTAWQLAGATPPNEEEPTPFDRGFNGAMLNGRSAARVAPTRGSGATVPTAKLGPAKRGGPRSRPMRACMTLRQQQVRCRAQRAHVPLTLVKKAA